VHAQRLLTGRTDWENISLLYEGLIRIAPTIGVMVGRAAAVAEAHDAARGFALLEAIPAEAIKNYQPYWALTAHLLKRMQRFDEGKAAYYRAIELCEDSAMLEFLAQQASQM
jgi:predicted RNA polymerase sigma factor